MKKITPKQEIFCDKYVECGNASEAYRFAYSCKNMKPDSVNRSASALLNDLKITSRVAELRNELRERGIVEKEEILKELCKVGFSSIADFHIDWSSRKPFEDLSEAQTAAIKAITTTTKTRSFKDGGSSTEETTRIELHDKLKALGEINKMLGFDAPTKVDLTSKGEKISNVIKIGELEISI